MLKLLTILLSGSPCQWWTRQQLTAGLIRRQSQLKKLMSHVRRLFRAISVKIVELAGTNQFQMFATVNTKKNSLGNKDSVISKREARTASRACTWSGPQASSSKPQASSFKHQASSFRTNLFKHQATSVKPQAASFKRQATSGKLPDSRSTVHGY